MAIASTELQLPVPLMLLLNGGEETVLTAAHGFMQHSSWAKQVTNRCLSLHFEDFFGLKNDLMLFAIRVGLADSSCLSGSWRSMLPCYIACQVDAL